MDGTVVFCVLNAKYIHFSPAPWCLAAGVLAYQPHMYIRVHIVEASVNEPIADVLKRIVDAAPAVVGFSCYVWNIDATLELCSLLKQVLKGVLIVLGGPEVSYCVKDVLKNNTQIDYILKGEGEESVPKFLSTIFEGKQLISEQEQQSIPGLCGRCADGSIFEGEAQVCNVIPSPLTAGYAGAIQGRMAYFETSRGCPYACAFCLSGRQDKLRLFPLDGVFQDLIRISNSGTKTIKFVDRTFNANMNHANQILQFILLQYGKEIPHGICFHFEIAGDILREETFALLAQMPLGAVQLEIGVQSFHEKTLDAVNRKTDAERLQANIRRLTAMGTMHIHIDLIAGLPHEGLAEFAQSFNKGYALGAHALQLGFLKLLHGSTLRNNAQTYPFEYHENAPYEVRATPWLSQHELTSLHHMADAVDRVHNSGRFSLSVAYVIHASGLTPFAFFFGLGYAGHQANLHHKISLDEYTAFLLRYCSSLPNVDATKLRDLLVRDRLSSNATGRLPQCLYRQDNQFAKVMKSMAKKPETAPKKGVRRGCALLYTTQSVCWADYIPSEKNPVTGRWPLHEISLHSLNT